MPWYYAGPDSKPVGPISLEELHARRITGDVKPETYIIEHTGQQAAPGWTWKRYSEIFPPAPAVPLPPTPPFSSVPPVPPAGAVTNPPTPGVTPPQFTPHPLFPSATPVPGQASVFVPAHRPDPYYQPARPTNALCGWGFGLAAIALCSSVVCFGIFLAVPAFFLCIAGLAQVQKKAQGGRGLAIWGLVLSVLAAIISLTLICVYLVPMVKNHEMTVTEQSSTDSE